MSTRVSPLRSLSTSAADSATVDPSTVFAYDPWANASSDHLKPTGSVKKVNNMKPKRLYMDLYHNEPVTPMRKTRGQSISSTDMHPGLVTPQSANRSFSTSSIPMFLTPMENLPSPLDTPLTTPMKNPADNPFDFLSDPKIGSEWNFEFDFHANSPPAPLLVDDVEPHHNISTVSRSDSASSFGSRSEEDLGDISSSSISSGPVTTTGKNGGVNPFYSPPPFLQAAAGVSTTSTSALNSASTSAPSAMSASSMNSSTSVGPSPVVPHDFASLSSVAEHPFPGEDAGVSPKATTDGFLANDQTPFGGSLCMTEPTGFDMLAFQARSDGCINESTDRLPSPIDGMVRARSSSTASWNSSTADQADKPFSCESCTKRFRRMEHLRRHMKTHTRERPFACTVENCGRRFSRTDNLKAHILTHTKKSGRNIYVEGLVETQQIKPIKRRKPRKPEAETELNLEAHLTI